MTFLTRLVVTPKSMIQPRHLNAYMDCIFLVDEQHVYKAAIRLLGALGLRHRKASRLWVGRIQVMQKLERTDDLLESELLLIEKCNKYEPRNYYVWIYRQQLRSFLTDELKEKDKQLVETYLKKEPKDHSAEWYL